MAGCLAGDWRFLQRPREGRGKDCPVIGRKERASVYERMSSEDAQEGK